MIHLTDKNSPLHEKLEIGILLAIVGGFLDVYSYLCYDHVFANAQTGNMILLGISLINGEYAHFFDYLIPIVFFSFGIFITEYLFNKLSVSFYVWILLTEIIILFMIAFLSDDIPNVIVTSAISFMSSIQIGSFKKVCGAPYTSTMCTGNLRSAMGLLYVAIASKDSNSLIKSLRYLTIIFFFCAGAAVGSIFVLWWGRMSVLICCILLLFLLLLIIRDILYIKRKHKQLKNIIQ